MKITKEEVLDAIVELLFERFEKDHPELFLGKENETINELKNFSNYEGYKNFRIKVIEIMREKNFSTKGMQTFIKLYISGDYQGNLKNIEPNLAYINPNHYDDFINYLSNKCREVK